VRLRVSILGIGEPPGYSLRSACETVENCFSADCSIEGYEPLRREFYDQTRGQYRAEALLRSLYVKAWDRLVVGLVQGDGYAGNLNFVFGIASPAGGVALVFLPRLRPEFYGQRGDRDVFLSRLRKEVLHEVGHVLGLEHCSNYCVMRFSNSISDVDEKPPGFCKDCREKLARIGVEARCLAER